MLDQAIDIYKYKSHLNVLNTKSARKHNNIGEWLNGLQNCFTGEDLLEDHTPRRYFAHCGVTSYPHFMANLQQKQK